MRQLQLSPANLDLLRRLDHDQDGRITATDVQQALVAGLLPAGALEANRARMLQRLAKRPGKAVRVAYGRMRLDGPRDWRWAASRLKTAMAARHGLPALLMQTDRLRVTHGDDPGNYYCEHLFYTLQHLATEPTSPILRNDSGEALVGFLHVPTDPASWQDGGECLERHLSTQQVAARALRGWIETLWAADEASPVRLLLTGFAAFRRIRNNPTGDFVSQARCLDATVALAFPGSHLEVVDAGVRHYVIPRSDGERRVSLHGVVLPVSDAALTPTDEQSIQRVVHHFAPHAILAMGVASTLAPGTYIVESHADDQNLLNGQHVRSRPPSQSMPATYALARAIHWGATQVHAKTPAPPATPLEAVN